MQLPDISDTTAVKVVPLADSARKTRVLYAGDMEFAKAQFSSVAPQLQLIAAGAVLGHDAPLPAGDMPDVAVIDCHAPGVDARAVVDAIRTKGLDLPIVLALDPNGGDHAPTKVTAELRVDDYTVKLPGWLARLTSRLEFAIAHHRRRRSLEALQTSAERLRTVVESAPVCLTRVARDGTILAMNAAAMNLVSAQAPEDVLGKSLLAFVEPEQVDEVRRFIDSVSAGQPGSLEFETGPSAGANRVVDTRAVPLSSDAEGRASALLVLRDHTDRKRLEASMIASAGSDALTAAAANAADAEARERLQQQLDEAVEETRRLQAERDSLRGEIEEAKARAAMVDHVRAACTTAEQQLREAQAERERAVTERNALNDDLMAARQQLEITRAQLAAREPELAQLQNAAAERAHLTSRCEALETQVASLEARQTAEREEHRVASEKAAAEIRRLQAADALVGEREGLLASLGALRSQFDEINAALNATEARHAAEMLEQQRATSAAEARLRESEQNHARLAAERDELQAALHAVRSSESQLRHALDETRAGHQAQAGETASLRQTLEQRLQELEGRLRDVAAERDGLLGEVNAARTRIEQLQQAVEAARADADNGKAEAHAYRSALEQQRDDLQARLERAVAERDAVAEELRRTAAAGTARIEQLEGVLRDAQARYERDEAQAESIRRDLAARIDELEGRTQAAAAERDATSTELRRALDLANVRTEQLQAALREVQAARDAQANESESVRLELTARIQELERRAQTTVAERDAASAELRRAVDAANQRTEHLQGALSEAKATRDAQASQNEAARRELTARLEEFQKRIDAAAAERDAIRNEMQAALDAANTRSTQLKTMLDELRAGRQAQAAEGDALRRTLARRVEELQTRLDETLVDRETLERAVDDARSELTARVNDAAAERASLQLRLEQRDAEYANLCARYDELSAAALEATSRTAAQHDVARETVQPEAGLQDAQVAFRDAVQMLSGELQSAVETTRAQHAALLRCHPRNYDLLEERLRQAETECRRLLFERDEQETTERALRAEIEQLIEVRRDQRKELVRALQESDETERRAKARLAECARLRQMLAEAQGALQRLSTWASTQSARLGPETHATDARAPRTEAPAPRSDREDDDDSAPPVETSWN